MLSTESKIKIARVLYRLLKLAGFKDHQLVQRSGIRFLLDLREGIDLSIFLSGGFQKQVASVPLEAAEPVILDVGANIGAITLALANLHPRARVHSFEPTHFALGKLKRNLQLNPQLAARVTVNHTFVGRQSGTMPKTEAATFSSWRVDGGDAGEVHATHLGSLMGATDAITSLDDYVAAHGISAVHLLKIDTDGHEMDVLAGARTLLAAHRPRIIMEMCPYLLRDHQLTLADFEKFLGPLGYRMTEIKSGAPVTTEMLDRIPEGGGIDVLAESR